jgi:hypothetical protein
MKNRSSLLVVLVAGVCFLAPVGNHQAAAIGDGLGQIADTLTSPALFRNSTNQNALTIEQKGNVGEGRADAGALLIDNSGNQNTGLTVYSDQADPHQPLARLEIDNPDWHEEVLYIHSDSDTSRGLIRLDSPAPEIEFVETDQQAPGGKFEVRVQNDNFQINSRMADDGSFENAYTFAPYREGAKFGVGDTSPDAHIEVVGEDTPAFFLSSSRDADGDIMKIDEHGNIVLNQGSLNVTSGQVSNFSGGINITDGCIAIDGTCVIGGEAGMNATDTSDIKNEESAKDSADKSDEVTTADKPSENSSVEGYDNDYEYLFMDVEDKEPPAKDCNSQEERGRFAMQRGSNRVYICNGPDRGWDYIELNDE